jgi:hypothetical protein
MGGGGGSLGCHLGATYRWDHYLVPTWSCHLCVYDCNEDYVWMDEMNDSTVCMCLIRITPIYLRIERELERLFPVNLIVPLFRLSSLFTPIQHRQLQRINAYSTYENISIPTATQLSAETTTLIHPTTMSEATNQPLAAAASSVPVAAPVEIDLTKLNALSPEVISKQATVSDRHVFERE